MGIVFSCIYLWKSQNIKVISSYSCKGHIISRPKSRNPWADTPPCADTPQSGRYASYSNAFLLPPANKFAKVMFLHLSVSHSVHRGSTWAGTPPGRYTPLGKYTPDRYTPLAGTPPPRQVHPPDRYTPQQVHPPGQVHPLGAVHAGRYGQQAGGMHPTGMHSCL